MFRCRCIGVATVRGSGFGFGQDGEELAEPAFGRASRPADANGLQLVSTDAPWLHRQTVLTFNREPLRRFGIQAKPGTSRKGISGSLGPSLISVALLMDE